MAKARRTRKQKVRAQQRIHTYSLPKISVKKTARQVAQDKSSLFAYDPGLIRSDLTKTLVLSILAVATIVVIFLLKII